MADDSRQDIFALFTRYMEALGWTFLVIFFFTIFSVLWLFYGVPRIAPVLSPHLVDLGMTTELADFVASVAIHVAIATLLLVYVTKVVRSRYYDPIPKWSYETFPMYMWAKEYVEEYQLGGEGAEQWPETPPSRAEMVMAFGLSIVVLTVGVFLLGAPMVGLTLAIGGHALARHHGIRPVRPLSWHLALTPLLISVATALLTALLYIDGAIAWFNTVADRFVNLLFLQSDPPLVATLLLLLSHVVTYFIVAYVGMYYLLIAYDSWWVRSGSRPTSNMSSTDDRESLTQETADCSTPDDTAGGEAVHIPDTPVPPKTYRRMAGVVLLSLVVVPLVDDTVVGAVAVMGTSLLVLAMVVIEFGVPSGTLVDGLIGGTVLALLGGLVVSTASLAGVVSGPLETALFWMAVAVGVSVGFIGRIAMVAERPAHERPT